MQLYETVCTYINSFFFETIFKLQYLYFTELSNVFHSGQVEAGTFVQKVTGAIKTGVILRDVSLEVHGGELSAVLGSKGSGKRALLEVISRRAQGPTRGQILLNGVPMSMRLFQVLLSQDFIILFSTKKFSTNFQKIFFKVFKVDIFFVNLH